jgi:hypothetical protein
MQVLLAFAKPESEVKTRATRKTTANAPKHGKCAKFETTIKCIWRPQAAPASPL